MKKLRLTLLLFLVSVPLLSFALVTNPQATDLEEGSDQFWSKTDGAEVTIINDFTISMWVKWESLGDQDGLYDKWLDFNKEHLIFYSGSSLEMYTSTGGSCNGQNGFAYTWTPDLGVWYHIVMTKQGTSGLGYVNGVQVSSGTLSLVNCDSTTALRIGDRNAVGSLAHDGSIDDVRVWTRALQADEVQFLYKHPCAQVNEDFLLNWWKFDGNGIDAAGGNANLTNNNVATFVNDPAFTCLPLSPLHPFGIF